MEYTLKQAREAFKDFGFKLKTKRHSDFIAVTILNSDGKTMPSIFTKETLETFRPAIELRKAFKGRVFEGGLRVVL